MLTFWVVLVISYLYHGMGITVGYHRLLSHRAFKCPRWVEYFIVSGGYLALEGSPIAWVATHRVHHRYSDMEGDPHSPRDGWYHAFIGWLQKPIVKFTGDQIERTVPDLQRDPVYRFFDFNHTKTHAWVCLTLCVLLRVALFVYLGPLAVVANIIGMLPAFIGPFWVNSVCHMQEFGYRNFVTEDGSRNVWWVGLIGLGEGWHNNHHAVPQSARHGLKPAEFDISWYFIALLQALGLATEVRLPKGSRNLIVIDQALAQQLNVPCAVDEAVAVGVARDQLQEQVVAARAVATQMLHACEEQLDAARVQLAEQMIAACDKLNDELTSAKNRVGGQIAVAADQLHVAADQIVGAADQMVVPLLVTADSTEELVSASVR